MLAIDDAGHAETQAEKAAIGMTRAEIINQRAKRVDDRFRREIIPKRTRTLLNDFRAEIGQRDDDLVTGEFDADDEAGGAINGEEDGTAATRRFTRTLFDDDALLDKGTGDAGNGGETEPRGLADFGTGDRAEIMNEAKYEGLVHPPHEI